MPKSIPYTEGDLFAVPLQDHGYGVGLTARASQEGVVVGYFFGASFDVLPSADQLEKVRAKDVVLVERFGDLGLMRGNWPIIGRLPSWRREDWPTPVFKRQEPLTGRLLRVEYSDDNPNRRPRETEAPQAELDDLPEDGLAGFEYVQVRLTRLLRALAE